MSHCCQCHIEIHHNSFYDQHQRSIIIRHVKSGLVLDATSCEVKLQDYKGINAQKWKLEWTEFIIINKKNWKVLDIKNGVEENASLITYLKHGDVNQQWYINSDGTIECPEESLVLSAVKSEFVAGTPIIAALKKGDNDQKF